MMTVPDKTDYIFESYQGDPLKTRVYTLGNGLKVFMSVYRDAPSIQTYIAVKAGSKNDPPETTGLAHYFEHMMFKGTVRFGTSDWEKERPYIEQIEHLFEEYRTRKDESERASIYRKIDCLSYEASQIAIPNEYDKLMDAIGSQGSNAGTSNDYTVYMENIPANQVENWARIQAERFSNPVLRLFHTEVETVFEEKNRSLTNDLRKVSETMFRTLFPNHPYGRQTTLGEAEHLKNPSMKNIREFFAKYYVPNNMAICMSGDLDPDAMIRIIDRYFGKLKPGTVPELSYDDYHPLTQPGIETITGLEAENVRLSWGFGVPASSREALILQMISAILFNGKTGLIDLNINQQQKTLDADCYPGIMNDYCYLTMSGHPKTGQTLDEVKDLLLEQVMKLKKGDFPEWLTEAVVNNFRLTLLRQNQDNQGRAMSIANAFVSCIPYERFARFMDEIGSITRDEILNLSHQITDQNYSLIYKKQGPPDDVLKIPKPPITPICINYSAESSFLKEIKNTPVEPIAPVFLDFQKDLDIVRLSPVSRLLYTQNTEDETFSLTLHFNAGRNSDKELHFATALLPYLGTSKHSAAWIKQEFFRIACDFDICAREEEINLTISGLSSGFERSMELTEELLTDCQPDQQVLDDLVINVLQSRQDQKSNQQEVFNALISYGTYGEDSPFKNLLPERELRSLKAEALVSSLRKLCGYPHDILYYGPMKTESVISFLQQNACAVSAPGTPRAMKLYVELPTKENQVFFVHYDAQQARLQTIIREFQFDAKMMPVVTLFDQYISNLSFKELREKRALAYTAWSHLRTPRDQKRYFMTLGFVGTQNDKVMDAFQALDELYDEMPLTETGFQAAADAVLNRIRSERITKSAILQNFINTERRGLQTDIRKDIFSGIQSMKSHDIRQFQENFLKSKAKTYLVAGKESEMDFEKLSKLGSVIRLSPEDIFGY